MNIDVEKLAEKLANEDIETFAREFGYFSDEIYEQVDEGGKYYFTPKFQDRFENYKKERIKQISSFETE